MAIFYSFYTTYKAYIGLCMEQGMGMIGTCPVSKQIFLYRND